MFVVICLFKLQIHIALSVAIYLLLSTWRLYSIVSVSYTHLDVYKRQQANVVANDNQLCIASCSTICWDYVASVQTISWVCCFVDLIRIVLSWSAPNTTSIHYSLKQGSEAGECCRK